jgi:lambda family phage minor tail protein L
LTVANLGGEISALLLIANTFTPGNDLGGAVVTRIRTLKKYLDGEAAADPNARFPAEIWYIDRKSAETRDVVQWELASKFDLAGTLMPKRQLIANICQWEYRSAECSYTGSNYFDINNNVVGTLAADRCGKRLKQLQAAVWGYKPIAIWQLPWRRANAMNLTDKLQAEIMAHAKAEDPPRVLRLNCCCQRSQAIFSLR